LITSVKATRHFISLVMVLLLPLSSMAADTGAVLHTKGGVWVNGAEAVDSTSIFSGDLVETKPGFVADLDSQGSSVLIQPETILKFQGTFIALEHGIVSVETSTSLSVHVNCLEIEPITSERTQYDVKDTTGTVQVAATKSDVKFTQTGKLQKSSKPGALVRSAIVHEGEQAKHEESACGGASPQPGAHSFPTKWLEIGAAGGGAIALCLVFCKSRSPSDVSPDSP
jgi:hypothetical protein